MKEELPGETSHWLGAAWEGRRWRQARLEFQAKSWSKRGALHGWFGLRVIPPRAKKPADTVIGEGSPLLIYFQQLAKWQSSEDESQKMRCKSRRKLGEGYRNYKRTHPRGPGQDADRTHYRSRHRKTQTQLYLHPQPPYQPHLVLIATFGKTGQRVLPSLFNR